MPIALCPLGDVPEKDRTDIHGVDRALRPHLVGEQVGEQPRPRADVGHGSGRAHADGANDEVALREHVSRVVLETANQLLNVRGRVGELLVHLGWVMGRLPTSRRVLSAGTLLEPPQRE